MILMMCEIVGVKQHQGRDVGADGNELRGHVMRSRVGSLWDNSSRFAASAMTVRTNRLAIRSIGHGAGLAALDNVPLQGRDRGGRIAPVGDHLEARFHAIA
ncbi:MAG: hypothetical protein AB7L90_17060 [Hyphomicrobiaceae bacterium]|jgi:hypothetical protein